MSRMISPKLATVITLGVICLYIENTYARDSYLDWWAEFYPFSSSDDIECQLCHVNPNGNAPWNAYGIQVRNILDELNALGGGATQQQLEEAFEFAEQGGVNSVGGNGNFDNDPSGASSLVEINNHYQPGWAEGAVNTIYDEDGPTLTNQMPPIISVDSTKHDPAIPTANNIPPVRNGDIVLGLETVADGFSAPVMAARAPGLPGFLFVVEQSGIIWRVDLSDGSRIEFYDVRDGADVSLSFGGERGLLGLAFDPDYSNNGYFYTYQSESNDGTADFTTMPNGQTANHQTVISEWATVNPASINSFAVSNTRRVVLRIDQPQGNHNGGMINFGPDDSLYIALGDGGCSDDNNNPLCNTPTGHGFDGNSRDNTNILGAMLRINPRGNDSMNGEYGIPGDNPFVAGGSAGDDDGLDEIYAYGFRNPYRFSFDSLCFENGQSCNTLFLGDVGQSEVEEIDNVVSGGNYGWNWKEGSFFFFRPTPSIYGGGKYISLEASPSVPNDLIDPIAEYNSGSADGRSAVGGYVYRGSEIPELAGRYVFADFFERLYYIDTNDEIRRFRMTSAVNLIAGFGEDDDKELYVLSRAGVIGALQKLVPSELDDELCLPIRATNNNLSVICL